MKRLGPVYFVLLLLICGLSAAAANADGYSKCQYVGDTCLESGYRTISGVQVYQACWRTQKQFKCLKADPVSYCAGLQAAPECIQVSSTCISTDFQTGACVKWRNVYGCNGTEPTDANVIDVGPTYTITRDEQVSECGDNETNPNCQQISETCVEGPETRIINTVPVYKECWKWERNYGCFTNQTKTDCGELPNQCTWAYDTCLSEDSNGNCLTTEKTYKCTQNTGGTTGPGDAQCEEAVYCIDGDCDTIQRVPNQDFASSITWLSLLNGMAHDFDSGDLSVFKGEPMACDVAIVGFSDCCQDSGWGQNVGLSQCSEQEQLLAAKMDAKLGVYVGTYCSTKVIGVCIEKKRSYCVFTSKLGRIINEQGRPQLGKSWGDPKNPDCSGLTVADLQHIDFSKIDLTELYADVQANIPNPTATTQQMADDIRSRYDNH